MRSVPALELIQLRSSRIPTSSVEVAASRMLTKMWRMLPPTPPLSLMLITGSIERKHWVGGGSVGAWTGQPQRTTRGTGVTLIVNSAAVGSGGPLEQPDSASVARRARAESFVISRDDTAAGNVLGPTDWGRRGRGHHIERPRLRADLLARFGGARGGRQAQRVRAVS